MPDIVVPLDDELVFEEYIPSSEDIEGSIRRFYEARIRWAYADAGGLGVVIDAMKRNDDPRAIAAAFDVALFGSMKLNEHDKGERFTLRRADVSEDAISYFEEREQHAVDIAHRAVYCDFLLSIGHPPDRRERLARTITAYLDAYDLFLDEGFYILLGDALTQALTLAAGTAHTPRAAERARAVLERLTYESGGGALNCSKDILDWLIRKHAAYREHLPAFFLLGIIERIVVSCDNNRFEDKEHGGFYDRPLYEERHKFLDLAVKLARKVRDNDLALHYQRRVADSHVAEAEWWASNGLYDAAYRTGRAYQDAAKAYAALGLADKAACCQRLMQEEMEAVPDTYISVPSSVQPADVADSLARYDRLPPADVFALLIREELLFPLLEEYKRAVVAVGEENALFLDIPIASYRDGLPAGTAEEPDEKVRFHAVRQMLGDFRVAVATLLIPLLDRLAADPLLLIGSMRERLQASGFASAVHVTLCANGAASYARGDYIAAVNTLVPLVEGLLRDLTIADEQQRFTYRATRTREETNRVTLDTLITDLREDRPEDAALFDLLRVLLTDLLGDNLRNVVAHAFGDERTYGKQNAAVLILLLIRISFMPVRSAARRTA